MLTRECEPLGGSGGRHGAHACVLEHVPGQLRVLLVVVDDQHELCHSVILWTLT